MNKNFEIKCKIENYEKTGNIIKALKKFSYSAENQTDIYYRVSLGRLKLRIINNKTGNLIFYDRGENEKKRVSKYIISRTDNFKELDEILRRQFNVLISVQKKREIFIKDNIRIHLDNVKGLGKFLEVEIIYTNNKSPRSLMKEIILYLNLNENDFIQCSYSDLLIKQK